MRSSHASTTSLQLVDRQNGLETAGLQRCRERACAAVEKIENISGADETAGLRWLGLSRRGITLNYTPIDIAAGLQKLFASPEPRLDIYVGDIGCGR